LSQGEAADAPGQPDDLFLAHIFGYINGCNNARRRHSYLGGISPLAFEAKVA
jgi:hypothetical protein